jgi:hypothetical protein
VLDADTSNTDEATTQNDSGSTPDANPAERPVKKAPAKKAAAKKA